MLACDLCTQICIFRGLCTTMVACYMFGSGFVSELYIVWVDAAVCSIQSSPMSNRNILKILCKPRKSELWLDLRTCKNTHKSSCVDVFIFSLFHSCAIFCDLFWTFWHNPCVWFRLIQRQDRWIKYMRSPSPHVSSVSIMHCRNNGLNSVSTVTRGPDVVILCLHNIACIYYRSRLNKFPFSYF